MELNMESFVATQIYYILPNGEFYESIKRKSR